MGTDSTVTYGSAITTKANGITTSKLGTLYVIPYSTKMSTITSQSDLDALVTANTALKYTVTKPAAISIPTKTSKTSPFTLTTASADFKVIEADLAGTLSNVPTAKITMNNAAAPALTATAVKSATSGAKVSVTDVTGDSFAYKISSSKVATPITGTDLTADLSNSVITPLAAGGVDITGVDATTNKYLAVYEYNSTTKTSC